MLFNIGIYFFQKNVEKQIMIISVYLENRFRRYVLYELNGNMVLVGQGGAGLNLDAATVATSSEVCTKMQILFL